MHLCPHVDVTGWTLDYARSFAQAAPARIISNLTIPPRVQTTNYPMPCCQYLLIPLTRIWWSLRLLRLHWISRYPLPVYYPNCSLTMSACAHRLRRYPLKRETSLPGTSASLLTNPSLTNFLSNYPIWPTAPPIPLKSASSDSDVQPDLPDAPETSPGAGTAPSFKRGRGRPPKAQKKRLIRAKARNKEERNTEKCRN